MRTELYLLLLVCLTCTSLGLRRDLDEAWKSYKQFYAKNYTSNDSEIVRRGIWEFHLEYIQKHNIEADRGMHTYWMGESEYTDMTNEEFRFTMNGYLKSNKTSQNQYVSNMTSAPTAEVDWRSKGYVTPVKNQKHCGSCWAFSTTGSLEGQHFKKTNLLVSLSEQNLIDCSRNYGNYGCHGGLVDNSFLYIKYNGGIDTEHSYPYKHKDKKCKFKSANVGATVRSFVDVKSGSEDDLEKAVNEIGPISVAIDASHKSFQHYKKGVYQDKKCSQFKLDHAVLVVGYGYDEGQKVWIVKNSWGTGWGEKGYFNLAKGDNNMCGIATQASYPLV